MNSFYDRSPYFHFNMIGSAIGAFSVREPIFAPLLVLPFVKRYLIDALAFRSQFLRIIISEEY